MIKSFLTAILAMALLMGTGIAWAGTVHVGMAHTVNIGLGHMDQAEFEALRQMVSGEYQPTQTVVRKKAADVHVAEFNWSDVKDLRQAMAFGGDHHDETVAVSTGQLVEIGLGTMPTSEFCGLNNLVASNSGNPDRGFEFMCP